MLLRVAFSYEKVGCPVFFSLAVVCLPGQMEREVKAQRQLCPSFAEFSFQAKYCKHWDVVTMRVSQ